MHVVVDYSANSAQNDILNEALIAFNERIMGEPRDKEFSIFLKNEAEKICGGILAHFDKESVYIDVLFVEESIRKQGHGKKILEIAEQEAIKNGCIFSTVETLDFQAEAFYLKRGYERMGEIKNYWYRHSLLFLRKNLGLTAHC